MCGIVGWFNRDGTPIDPVVLETMTSRLIHRGPDDGGTWFDGGIGLGHRRLSIRDLSRAGRQPMSDPSGYVHVTYNGEIYNYQALRRELEVQHGFHFKTNCDTELLPAGYLAWGENLIARLEGMFALAIWDSRDNRLVLARDSIGIKPLFLHESPSRVLFSSELKGILANPLAPRTLDAESLHTYFATGQSGPGRTLIAGIRQLRPGSILTITSESAKETVYWHPKRTGEIRDLNTALDVFIPLWREVVDSHLVSDVPLGVLQSGGIDSSLVSLSLKGRSETPLFTAGFDDSSYDESELAGMVAARAGLHHHILPIHADNSPPKTFLSVVKHFDSQCADTGAYAFYRLSGEVRKHTTVVLSGDGGDEFFGGYDTYAASRVADRLRHVIPSFALRFLGEIAYHMGARNEKRLPQTAIFSRFALGLAAGGAHAHVQWRRMMPDFLLKQTYGSAMLPFLNISPFKEYESALDGSDGTLVDRCMLADQQFHLQSILAKVDAMSMAHGLEVRVPFLDRRIMDFAARCSVDLLCPGKGPRKLLLREAAARLGAPEPILRESKKGFNVPIANLLRTSLAPLAEQYFELRPDLLEPYLLADRVRDLWRAHRDLRTNHAFALWPLLSLAAWLSQNDGYGIGKQ